MEAQAKETKPHLRIVVREPPTYGGSFYYRAVAPIGHCGHKFKFSKKPASERADVAFFWCPQGQEDLQAMLELKKKGVRIISDFDDDVFNLPEDIAGSFAHEEYRKITAACIQLSDVVFTSTLALQTKLSTHGRPTVVISNGFDLVSRPFCQIPKYNHLILWRGAKGHQQDWEEAEPIVASLLDRHRGWKMLFMGEAPDIKPRIIKERMVHVPIQAYGVYLKNASTLAPAVMLVPLRFSAHNLVKSNCAWLEGSYVGATVVAPAYPEWQVPGVTNYKDEIDLYCKMDWLMNRVGHRTLVHESRRAIENNLSVEKINIQREAHYR